MKRLKEEVTLRCKCKNWMVFMEGGEEYTATTTRAMTPQEATKLFKAIGVRGLD